jgi:hypothetical protein
VNEPTTAAGKRALRRSQVIADRYSPTSLTSEVVIFDLNLPAFVLDIEAEAREQAIAAIHAEGRIVPVGRWYCESCERSVKTGRRDLHIGTDVHRYNAQRKERGPGDMPCGRGASGALAGMLP